jgi:hypothetical protein
MTRTKWMRLLVRDPADLLRWVGEQQARHLSGFRHRVIGGRETFSFRMIPGYAIEVGAREIVVVCHVKKRDWRRVAGPLTTIARRIRAAYAGAASAAMLSLPVRPTPMKSTISAAPMHISPDSTKASR